MNIVTRQHLKEAMETYRDASSEIQAWIRIVSRVKWRDFTEVRSTFKDADSVGRYVVFNIRRNRYRLIAILRYSKLRENGTLTEGHAFIRSFLTHKEYDNPKNWDRRYGQK